MTDKTQCEHTESAFEDSELALWPGKVIRAATPRPTRRLSKLQPEGVRLRRYAARPSLVVWAIREGRQAAHSVGKVLMGSTMLPVTRASATSRGPDACGVIDRRSRRVVIGAYRRRLLPNRRLGVSAGTSAFAFARCPAVAGAGATRGGATGATPWLRRLSRCWLGGHRAAARPAEIVGPPARGGNRLPLVARGLRLDRPPLADSPARRARRRRREAHLRHRSRRQRDNRAGERGVGAPPGDRAPAPPAQAQPRDGNGAGGHAALDFAPDTGELRAPALVK